LVVLRIPASRRSILRLRGRFAKQDSTCPHRGKPAFKNCQSDMMLILDMIVNQLF
jgi:hypothetical protein